MNIERMLEQMRILGVEPEDAAAILLDAVRNERGE